MFEKFIGSSTETSLSIGGETLTSSSCMVESVNIRQEVNKQEVNNYHILGDRNIHMPPSGLIRIEINLVATEISIFDSNMSKKSIKNKKVEDCTIQELLFAVRQKVKKA